MEETQPLTPLQELRKKIASSCPNLPDWKIIEMCSDYGINYDMPDTNTLRLFMILASAEQKLLEHGTE